MGLLHFLGFILFHLSLLLPPEIFHVADLNCGNLNTTTGSKELYMNFISVMDCLNDLICEQKWGFYSVRSPSPSLFGLAECHNDLSISDCELCFSKARMKISRCLPAFRECVILEGCYIRYDNNNFFSETMNKKYDYWKCGSSNKMWKGKEMEEFAKKVEAVVWQLTVEAVARAGFGVVEERRGLPEAYALGQCWNSLNLTECRVCLESAWSEVKKCLPNAAEGRGVFAGCYLRYSSHKLFGNSEELKEDDQWTLKTFFILFLVGIALTLLALLGSWVGYHKISEMKAAQKRFTRIPSSLNESDLNYSYEALEQATEFFGDSNKLGQGGSSSVFKETLPNGSTVAVKRLLFYTRPWVDDFFNEVNLISKVKHDNLVRLLSCSIEVPESLFEYEFVPNNTLDQILFGKRNGKNIKWKQRFNIVLGIAEGFAHLHGACEVKIFHRDI